MLKRIINYLSLSLILFPSLFGQNQCVYKPKKFPSAFPTLNFDYYGCANQPVTVQKGTFQIETTVLIENVIKEDYSETKEQLFNSNLLRVGIGNNLELRTHLNSIILNDPKSIHLGTAIKYSIPIQSKPLPYLGFLLNYARFNSLNSIDFGFISEINAHEAVSISADIGTRYNNIEKINLCYGIKSQMKPKNSKTGIFVIGTNKYLFLDRILLFGILFTNNKTFNITFSYGLTNEKSLFKAGFSMKFQT